MQGVLYAFVLEVLGRKPVPLREIAEYQRQQQHDYFLFVSLMPRHDRYLIFAFFPSYGRRLSKIALAGVVLLRPVSQFLPFDIHHLRVLHEALTDDFQAVVVVHVFESLYFLVHELWKKLG